MKLLIDGIKFLWFLRLKSSRKRWKHAKNYDMYWRFFVRNYKGMSTKVCK